MSKPRYGVARIFRTKRVAEKYVKDARKDGFGATMAKVADGYMVRRTDYPIK